MSSAPSRAVSGNETGPRHQPLVVVLAAASAGILSDRYCPLPAEAWWLAAVGGLAVWAALTIRKRTVLAGFVLLAVVAATAGAWRHSRWHLFEADNLARFARRNAQPVCVEAVAVRMPRRQPPAADEPLQMMPATEAWRFEADLSAIRDGAIWRPAAGRAIVVVKGKPPDIAAGDRIQCFAQFAALDGPRNPGAFDYAAFLRTDGIHSRLVVEATECVSVIRPSGWLSFAGLLDRVRWKSNRLLEEHLTPRCAEMAQTILLGEREKVDSGRTEDFMATGTIHLLVIAGLHLGILAGALLWLLQRTSLSNGRVTAVVALTTLFYVFLVDAGPPVVRAAVLVIIACAAAYWGRRAISFNSLAAAALTVLAMNPANLFHVGAQLSFLSVAGLMWFAPRWMQTSGERKTIDRLIYDNLGWLARRRWAAWQGMRHLILVSATIWLLTMPLVMARFHLCTPVAVLLNTLVWIPMAAGLLSGAMLLVVGPIAPPLAHLCGMLCNASLELMEWCVTLARQIPAGHLWVPGPADWWLWGFYGGLAVLAVFPRVRAARRWWIASLALWIAVGFGVSLWPRDRNRLDCTFLSMGHGCAAVLELPSGKTVLYDAGQMGSPRNAVAAIAEFLWNRGLTRIDAVVLSHPDLDHYNALPGLLEKFSVGTVYVSPMMFEKNNAAVAILREAIESRHIPVGEVRAGDRLRVGDGCDIEVLHPARYGVLGSDNANSIVLAVTHPSGEILLPGDLESPGLQEVLAEEPRRCSVLLAPHHGSRKSNSPELAAWCKPAWVVFSNGGRWSSSEIDASYRAVGSQTLHTHENGAIQVRLDAQGVRVTPVVDNTTAFPPSSVIDGVVDSQ